MAFIRFVAWTSICIGLGIFAASYEINGMTPLKHAKRAWQSVPFDKVKKLASSTPTETHSEEDRAAVNKLIVKRK